MTSELRKRFITSTILIAVFLGCLFISKFTWIGLLIIISALLAHEWNDLIKKILIRSKIKFRYFENTAMLFSFCYLIFFIVYSFYVKVENTEFIFLFIILICIFSDMGGYIVGKKIGGKKLTKISPNKTVSGMYGSFLFSLIPFFIYKILYILNNNEVFLLNYSNIFLCLWISLLCQLGDLFFSYFKRLAKVKDTGTILPGHGGLLDRLDGMLLAWPSTIIFAFYPLTNLPILVN